MSANVTIHTTATAGPTYAQIFGPVFWGFCVALILCGVNLLQGYLYFTRFNDKLGIRLLAYMMLTFDILSTALVCQSVYYYMGANRRVLDRRGDHIHVWPLSSSQHLMRPDSRASSQMYFVYQLHMAKTPGITAKIMKALVRVLVVREAVFHKSGRTSLMLRLGCVGIMFMFPENIFMHRNRAFAILAGIARGFGAGADIIATIAMCMFLQSAKTGIRRTSSMLQSLMHLIINRAILVTAAQTLLLIAFFATSQHLYWCAVKYRSYADRRAKRHGYADGKRTEAHLWNNVPPFHPSAFEEAGPSNDKVAQGIDFSIPQATGNTIKFLIMILNQVGTTVHSAFARWRSSASSHFSSVQTRTFFLANQAIPRTLNLNLGFGLLGFSPG
ncbi:hypothetical protein GGX14DRAFT_674252 [Mycena pura]|uniref:DUF6534 domain-containing protein n=1 Tax=Mycena pura TaxID=153505 RepID=A0AAD6Y0Z6_9AGAR|nr:hypothetical protein GGX14DRAFT_674252 [Mycena pura]